MDHQIKLDGKKARPAHEQQALASVTMFLTTSFPEKNETDANYFSVKSFCDEDDLIDDIQENSEKHEEDRAGELLLQVEEIC